MSQSRGRRRESSEADQIASFYSYPVYSSMANDCRRPRAAAERQEDFSPQGRGAGHGTSLAAGTGGETTLIRRSAVRESSILRKIRRASTRGRQAAASCRSVLTGPTEDARQGHRLQEPQRGTGSNASEVIMGPDGSRDAEAQNQSICDRAGEGRGCTDVALASPDSAPSRQEADDVGGEFRRGRRRKAA